MPNTNVNITQYPNNLAYAKASLLDQHDMILTDENNEWVWRYGTKILFPLVAKYWDKNTSAFVYNAMTFGATAFTGNITMANGTWIGLGSGAGRMLFTDAATDSLSILNAYLGLNCVPLHMLDIVGDACVRGTNGFATSGDTAYVSVGNENAFLKATRVSGDVELLIQSYQNLTLQNQSGSSPIYFLNGGNSARFNFGSTMNPDNGDLTEDVLIRTYLQATSNNGSSFTAVEASRIGTWKLNDFYVATPTAGAESAFMSFYVRGADSSTYNSLTERMRLTPWSSIAMPTNGSTSPDYQKRTPYQNITGMTQIFSAVGSDEITEYLYLRNSAGYALPIWDLVVDGDGNGNPSAIFQSNGSTLGASIHIYNYATAANNQYCGELRYYGKNSTQTKTDFGIIAVVVRDKTASSEDSDMEFYTQIAGVITQNMTLQGKTLLSTGTYGTIYLTGGGPAQNISTGSTFVKLTHFNTYGADGLYNDCTVDHANSKITITRAGNYEISYDMSFGCDTNNVSWTVGLAYDGTVNVATKDVSLYQTEDNIRKVTGRAFITAAAGKDIDLRTFHNNGGTVGIVPAWGNITIKRVGA